PDRRAIASLLKISPVLRKQSGPCAQCCSRWAHFSFRAGMTHPICPWSLARVYVLFLVDIQVGGEYPPKRDGRLLAGLEAGRPLPARFGEAKLQTVPFQFVDGPHVSFVTTIDVDRFRA